MQPLRKSGTLPQRTAGTWPPRDAGRRVFAGLVIVAIALISAPALVADASPGGQGALGAADIIERSYQAYYYAGDDMKARMTMELIGADGGTRSRVMTMLRRNDASGGNQKYFVYFHEPGDVRGMTFMVWKQVGQNDDRWIFVAAIDLIRRIAADDSRSSFVGSDFTYEDVSGREVTADEHELLREEDLEGRPCFVIESTPRDAAEYTRRVSWIDETTFLPLKEEYYDVQGDLYRVFTAAGIEEITIGEGPGATSYPTPMRRTMANLKTGHRTEVTFEAITYNVGLSDGDFSERSMRRPPRDWIR
jgi:hypothetical protein